MKKFVFLLFSFLVISACSSSNTDVTLQTAPLVSGDTLVTMETNRGTITIKLFPALVPETAKNFSELAKRGYYDGLTFHRVIDGFMIQGGDPLGNGTGGDSYKGPDTTIPDEFHKELTHLRGAVSMANAGPNTGSSQFFIVQPQEGTHFLDGRHAVFGQVVSGMNVVDAIVKQPTGFNDMPLEKVVMNNVTVSVVP